MSNDNPGLAVVAHVGTELLRHDDGRVWSWCDRRDDLSGSTGALLPGCIAFVVDGSGGLATGLAVVPDWVVTADLDLRLVGEVSIGPARTECRVVRRGRTTVIAQVAVVDEGDRDRLVGAATLTSAVLTPRFDAPDGRYAPGRRTSHGPRPSDPPPLRQWLGLATAGAPGSLALVLRPELCNPWGILHGGVTCLLGEAAMEDATGAAPGSVRDLAVRFLAPLRIGPAVTRTRVVGRRRGDVVVEVEVSDAGAGHRMSSLVTGSVSAP